MPDHLTLYPMWYPLSCNAHLPWKETSFNLWSYFLTSSSFPMLLGSVVHIHIHLFPLVQLRPFLRVLVAPNMMKVPLNPALSDGGTDGMD